MSPVSRRRTGPSRVAMVALMTTLELLGPEPSSPPLRLPFPLCPCFDVLSFLGGGLAAGSGQRTSQEMGPYSRRSPALAWDVLMPAAVAQVATSSAPFGGSRLSVVSISDTSRLRRTPGTPSTW